ncbi:hypothetical protein Sps_02469 [Shewanella psychrophila]|uniref:Isochorismatase-like domain-containing protein n=1 Tax=Shewanella psychrophila TaxID=225848 RepID=A0A1S6HQ16_9GAMM|nr:isochorismatase family protein [Shewanella psychrophila]AQS37623.1 hypothetical protein Sps_02469 [Shewanella psychrophila]
MIIIVNIALLLIDFHNDDYSTYQDAQWALSGTEAAAWKAATLLTAFRQQGLPVIHVRHEFVLNDAPFFLLGSEVEKAHYSVAPINGEL